MPKFKVKVKQVQDSIYGTVTVEAESKEDVDEVVDMLFQDDPDVFEWDEPDLTKLEWLDIVAVEEV